METQQSEMTAVASLTAALGSSPSLIRAPAAWAAASRSADGCSSRGQAMSRVKSKRADASIQEDRTLLESPLHAILRPLIGPLHSSKVNMSAITWQGCDCLVSPLITGTVACAAISHM